MGGVKGESGLHTHMGIDILMSFLLGFCCCAQPPWSIIFPELGRIPNNYTIIQNVSNCIATQRPSQCWLQPYGGSFQNNIGYLNKVWTAYCFIASARVYKHRYVLYELIFDFVEYLQINVSSIQLFPYFNSASPNFWNDPHFEDVLHGNFSLPADSPVFIAMPGFQPLPLLQMGVGGNTPLTRMFTF